MFGLVRKGDQGIARDRVSELQKEKKTWRGGIGKEDECLGTKVSGVHLNAFP